MPTLFGRRLIDGFKRACQGYIRLPVPPYGSPRYWDGCYSKLGPNDVFEWGNIHFNDLKTYEYSLIAHLNVSDGQESNDSQQQLEATLGETLQVFPNADQDEPLLMLGSGNSKMGEDMVEAGWRGPIVQVDVASRAIEAVSQRCGNLIQSGDMQFVQDDATVLSAFDDGTVSAVLDKGLMDALFCADQYEQCSQVMQTVHRVLKPGGTFVCLSYSQPDFLWEKLFPSSSSSSSLSAGQHRRIQKMWQNIQIRNLNFVLIYRFQKSLAPETIQISKRTSGGSRRNKNQKGRKRKH